MAGLCPDYQTGLQSLDLDTLIASAEPGSSRLCEPPAKEKSAVKEKELDRLDANGDPGIVPRFLGFI